MAGLTEGQRATGTGPRCLAYSVSHRRTGSRKQESGPLQDRGHDDPQPDVVVEEVGIGVDAVGDAAVPRIVVPGAAAQHTQGISSWIMPRLMLIVHILAQSPLLDVARHIQHVVV